MHDSIKVGVESHRLWWTMLLHRTLALAPILPAHLRGCIQFEVETDRGAVHFHLLLRGGRTIGRDGIYDDANTRVRTSDQKLHDLMFALIPPPNALLVSGDESLLRSLFEFLKNTVAPKSLLKTRCAP